MKKYIIKRLLNLIPVFFGITLVSFAVIHLAPGKPTDLMMEMNPKASMEAQERMEEIFGLNRPIAIQYLDWLRKIVVMDFGISFVDGRPVFRKIMERLPITLFINILEIAVILILSLFIGVISAVRRGSLFDRGMTVFVFAGFAMPSFWLALILMSFFGVELGWFPVSGIVSLDFEYYSLIGKIADLSRHLVLPVIVGVIGGLAGLSRYVRQSMLGVLDQDYVRTARAKGLCERDVITKHALKNALLPIVTILGLSVPGLISGSVIFESIFNIPGMGRLMVESVFTRDYNTVMAGLILAAFLTLLGNLTADIAYFYVDPRIRLQERAHP